MRALFFGDSFTSGEGSNNVSFPEYMPFSERNLGISGTTIGEYSIYPVDGNSLLSIIEINAEIIKNSDTIFLEYGINDTTSILCGFATLQKVVISFVKAIDWIRQLNPNCKIMFLSLSDNDIIIKDYAQLQCKYLGEVYFSNYDFNIPATIWANTYTNLISAIKKTCTVIPMIQYEKFLSEHLSDDNLHPNSVGYKKISDTIQEYI